MAVATRTRAARSLSERYAEVAEYYADLLHQPPREWECRWPPVTIGPTWLVEDGRYVLPQYSLGMGVLVWCGVWLQHEPGVPWRFTPEQARYIMWLYAIDETGRFISRDAVLQRLKGWGKDPVGACLCAAEMLGPVRFAGWDVDGSALAKDVPGAWVQTVAVSLAQTQNTMQLFAAGLFTEEAIKKYRIQVGVEKIHAVGGRKIEAVTSSPATLQGNRGTFILMNETHEWGSSNQGHEMARVLSLNATKAPDASSRTLRITNAYEPGADSVAQRDREAYEEVRAGKSVDVGLLYDSLEAGASAPLTAEAAPEVVESVRGDSTWLQVDAIVKSILDSRFPPSTSRRFWYNQVTAEEDAWVSPQEWDALEDKTHEVPPGAEITLGLDGSLTGDHTALIACEVETEHLFTLGIWDPERYTDKEIPRRVVDAAVEHAFATYDVVGFLSDVHLWETYIEKWEEEHGETLCVRATDRKPIAYDMRGHREETVRSIEAFHDAIVEGASSHDGHPLFRQHVHNARNRPWTSGTKVGMEFGKESPTSPRKIDAAAAAMLARKAMQAYKALPEGKRRGKSNDWFVV